MRLRLTVVPCCDEEIAICDQLQAAFNEANNAEATQAVTLRNGVDDGPNYTTVLFPLAKSIDPTKLPALCTGEWGA